MALREDFENEAKPGGARRVEISALSDDTMLLALCGDHDLDTKPRLLDALAAVRRSPKVIVDLTPCTLIDSTIISTLIGACLFDRPETQRVAIVAPDKPS